MFGGDELLSPAGVDLDYLMMGADSAHKLPFEFKFQAFPADPDVPLGGFTQGFEITSSFMNGAMEAQNAVAFPSLLGSAQNQGKVYAGVSLCEGPATWCVGVGLWVYAKAKANCRK